MSKLPDIKTKFPEWYNEVVYKSELADQVPVRGCIVIRPYGWQLWENIKSILDKRIKETGHENCSFPLLIPESFLKKEASHVEGFSPELAVVTHAGGKKLDEPLVVRPTSETIIHHMFSQWIKSWRDLPLKVNQWCSVVRWEMRARPFLRTSEFNWQEGHTAHATQEEADTEAKMMMDEYVKLAQDHLAIPVIVGKKSESEKFAGADVTYTYEAFMQDGKALQMGTSHLLSHNFAHAFDMKYQDKEGNLAYPYLTSWCGATTRLIGAIIAVHGDQNGLVLPPKVAPIQVVIVPIIKIGSEELVGNFVEQAKESLEKAGIRVKIDDRDHVRPGAKFFEWELKGVPLRIEAGPRDVAAGQVVVTDRLDSNKEAVTLNDLAKFAKDKLVTIQDEMFKRAKNRMQSMWRKGEKLADFGPALQKDSNIYQTGWCGDVSCERLLKKYKAFTRCLLKEKTQPQCFACDKDSLQDVVVAKAY